MCTQLHITIIESLQTTVTVFLKHENHQAHCDYYGAAWKVGYRGTDGGIQGHWRCREKSLQKLITTFQKPLKKAQGELVLSTPGRLQPEDLKFKDTYLGRRHLQVTHRKKEACRNVLQLLTLFVQELLVQTSNTPGFDL